MNNYNKVVTEINDLITDIHCTINTKGASEQEEYSKQYLLGLLTEIIERLKKINDLTKKRKGRPTRLSREDCWTIWELERSNVYFTRVKLGEIFDVSEGKIRSVLKDITPEEKDKISHAAIYPYKDEIYYKRYEHKNLEGREPYQGIIDYTRDKIHQLFNETNNNDVLDSSLPKLDSPKPDLSGGLDLSGLDWSKLDLLESESSETENTASSDDEEFIFELEDDDNEERKPLTD